MAELYWIAQNESDDDFDAVGAHGFVADAVERRRIVEKVQASVRFPFGTTLDCKLENGIVKGLVVPDRPDASGRKRTSLFYSTVSEYTPQFEDCVRSSLKKLLGEQILPERIDGFVEKLQIAFGVRKRVGTTARFFLLATLILGILLLVLRGC